MQEIVFWIWNHGVVCDLSLGAASLDQPFQWPQIGAPLIVHRAVASLTSHGFHNVGRSTVAATLAVGFIYSLAGPECNAKRKGIGNQNAKRNVEMGAFRNEWRDRPLSASMQSADRRCSRQGGCPHRTSNRV